MVCVCTRCLIIWLGGFLQSKSHLGGHTTRIGRWPDSLHPLPLSLSFSSPPPLSPSIFFFFFVYIDLAALDTALTYFLLSFISSIYLLFSLSFDRFWLFWEGGMKIVVG